MSILKGKFIQSDTLDGSKIKLENEQALRAKNADGSVKEIVKVNAQGKIELLDVPVVSSDPTEDGALSRKFYVDGKALQVQNFATTGLAQEKSERESADAALDMRLDTLEASQADKQYTDTKVGDEAAARELADEALDLRIDALEVDPVTKTYVDTKDQEGKQYADQKVADLVASAPAVLDTLKELADALGGDQNFAATVAGQIGTVDDKIDQEIQDRVASDNSLDARLDVLELDPITKSDVKERVGVVQYALNAEILRATSVETGINGRLTNVEENLATQTLQYFENNAAVYADGSPGIQDPSGRTGWYFKNDVTGKLFNWYFFDGSTESATLGSFSMYAVVTYDSIVSIPHLAVYSKATGSGDAASWYKSRKVYIVQGTPVVGKKYLIYAGQDPKVHPELPRLSMALDSVSTRGTQAGTEAVLMAVLGSNSSSSVGNVQVLAEELGVNDSAIKRKIELKIRLASKAALATEEAARIAGDAALSTRVIALETDVVKKIYVDQQIAMEAQARAAADTLETQTRQSNISSEAEARQTSDTLLSDRLSVLEQDPVTKSYVDAGIVESKGYADQKVADLVNGAPAMLDTLKELADALEAQGSELSTSILSQVGAIDSKLTQEISDRSAGDSSLDARLDSVELDYTKTVGQFQSYGGKPLSFYSDIDKKEITKAEYQSEDGSVVNVTWQSAWHHLAVSSFNNPSGYSSSAQIKPTGYFIEAADPYGNHGALSLESYHLSWYHAGQVEAGIHAGNGNLFIVANCLSLGNKPIRNIQDPTEAQDAATKAYVDQWIQWEVNNRKGVASGLQSAISAETTRAQAAETALDTRIDLLEAAPVFGKKELKTLGSNELFSVDCAAEAIADTMIVSVSGLTHYEGESYSLTVVDGKTRISWMGDLAPGGQAALVGGEKVCFQYLTRQASSGGDTPPPPPPPPGNYPLELGINSYANDQYEIFVFPTTEDLTGVTWAAYRKNFDGSYGPQPVFGGNLGNPWPFASGEYKILAWKMDPNGTDFLVMNDPNSPRIRVLGVMITVI